MNNDLEWMWKEAVIAELGHYPGIFLDRLRKTIDILSHSQNSKCAPSEYKLEASPLELICPVISVS
jgi:hypothetical protein